MYSTNSDWGAEHVLDSGIKLPPGTPIYQISVMDLHPTQLAVGMQQVGDDCSGISAPCYSGRSTRTCSVQCTYQASCTVPLSSTVQATHCTQSQLAVWRAVRRSSMQCVEVASGSQCSTSRRQRQWYMQQIGAKACAGHAASWKQAGSCSILQQWFPPLCRLHAPLQSLQCRTACHG